MPGTSLLGRRGERSRGAVAVETALLLPLLLLIVFGIIDFGRAYNAKQALTHATREGVRIYAVTQDQSRATDAFNLGATGLDMDKVTVSIPADDACIEGDPVEVSATYDFDFIALPFASIELGSEAVMRCGG
jgi:Flp pilus assembly protein TadG